MGPFCAAEVGPTSRRKAQGHLIIDKQGKQGPVANVPRGVPDDSFWLKLRSGVRADWVQRRQRNSSFFFGLLRQSTSIQTICCSTLMIIDNTRNGVLSFVVIEKESD